MKTYVMITGIANIVAGGPIYARNKIRYLKEREWNVVVFPTDDGEVYIQGLELYKGLSQPFLKDMPGEYTCRQRKAFLELLVSKIPGESEEIIIETGTDYSSYWGTLLAERLKARHLVLWLDEKNPNIGKRELEFLEYKYQRHELACITDQAMIQMFQGHMELSEGQTYSLACCCTNVVEEYDCDLVRNFPEGDYVIGSIGRLEKTFVPAIIEGILEFADTVPDKQIAVCFFGGSDQKTLEKTETAFRAAENIRLLITGYMYPLPAGAIKKCDIFISGAGSVWVSAECGVPTVRMDMYKWIPEGFVVDTVDSRHEKGILGNRIIDYLNQVLVYKKVPHIITNKTEKWESICGKFDMHMRFIQEMPEVPEGFAERKVIQLGMNRRRQVLKLIRGCLGLRLGEKAIDFYRRIKCVLFRERDADNEAGK